MMKQEGILGRRRFSTCGGTISGRPPHPDGRKLIRNASFGGYNELSVCLPGGSHQHPGVNQETFTCFISLAGSFNHVPLH